MRAWLTVPLRPLTLHCFIAADPATAAVAVEHFTGRADTGLARRIIKEVRRAITASPALPLLGQMPCAMAVCRGKARISFAKLVVGDIGVDLLFEQGLYIRFGVKPLLVANAVHAKTSSSCQ